MQSKFTVFGADIPEKEGKIVRFYCIGFLFPYKMANLFIFSPLYEVGEGDSLHIDSGIGAAIIPDVSDIEGACFRLLQSSGVTLTIDNTPLEKILGLNSILRPHDYDQGNAPAIQIPEIDTVIFTNAGEIQITRKNAGALFIAARLI